MTNRNIGVGSNLYMFIDVQSSTRSPFTDTGVSLMCLCGSWNTFHFPSKVITTASPLTIFFQLSERQPQHTHLTPCPSPNPPSSTYYQHPNMAPPRSPPLGSQTSLQVPRNQKLQSGKHCDYPKSARDQYISTGRATRPQKGKRKGETHSEIILIPPLKPRRQIMILQNHIPKPLQHHLTLIWIQLIDEFRKRPQSENTLPPCHGVRPDDGMHSAEFPSDIQGGATRVSIDLYFFGIGSCGFEETIADECRREGFEEFLIGAREAGVDFVAGCPAVEKYVSFLLLGAGAWGIEHTVYRHHWMATWSDGGKYNPQGRVRIGYHCAIERSRNDDEMGLRI